MLKLFVLLLLLVSHIQAIDFSSIKDNIVTYVEALDHPNKEVGNTFSKNLAITEKSINMHITIYSAGLAMVFEEKSVTIPTPGNVKIMYSDVPSKIDLSSVSMVFDKNVTLYSQKFAYDVVNFDSLLKRYVGKYILYINDENDEKQKKATLLATNPIIIRDLKSGNIFTPFKVFFENIPEDMAVTPTLFWDINTKSEQLGIKLEYLTDAIMWESDYNIYLKDNGEFDLNSWITITNNSGASYKDANITIVTGKINRVKYKDDNSSKTHKQSVSKVKKSKQKDSAEYAFYSVPHKEDLKNNEKKQITFIQGKGIPYKIYLMNDKQYDFKDLNKTVLKFSKVLAFENRISNHLGIALPQGIVKIYSYDTLSSKRFMGSTPIANIKENETVELIIADTKDVIGEEKMLSFKQTDIKEHITYVIKLKNTSSKMRAVKLKRSIPDKVGDVSIKDSCQKQCRKEQVSNLSILYHISLKPDQIYELEITYEINTKADVKKENL